MRLLNEGHLELEPRRVDLSIDRISELGDDHLLGFVDHKGRATDEEDRENHDRDELAAAIGLVGL